jgi:ABC-2 type transport system ATP-binding protein
MQRAPGVEAVEFSAMTQPQTSARPALLVRNLRKTYDDTRAVDGLDLTVNVGECFGLLGPNGAGKTTTIEICEGLTNADSGDVEILGLRWDRNEAELRQRLGIQLQETQLADKLSVVETVRLFSSFYSRGRPVDEIIKLVQLEEKRNAWVGKLSGGQKQRLALACAIVGEPDLIFLDEPTTGLDPQSRRQLWDLITEFKSLGRTIMLTTHYMDEAEILCDHIAIVDHGKVIALGTPQELIRSLGAEHVVQFGVSEGAPISDEELRSLDGVKSARRVADGYELQVGALHRTVPALLAMLSRQGRSLTGLTTHSASLEDVFVSLTGRQLRDE